jgi:hypothetical protein
VLQEKLSRCQVGSRRAQRLLKRKAQVSAKVYRQQRDLLHQAARTVMDFCQAEGVNRIAVGDVRDIQTGVSLAHVIRHRIIVLEKGSPLPWRVCALVRFNLVFSAVRSGPRISIASYFIELAKSASFVCGRALVNVPTDCATRC